MIDQVMELFKANEFITLQEENPDALILVFFYTNRCPNCKRLKPNYDYAFDLLKEEGFLAEHPVIFIKTLTSVVPDLIEKHTIMGVPTVIFLKSGELLYRFSGVTDYERLAKKVKDLINEF